MCVFHLSFCGAQYKFNLLGNCRDLEISVQHEDNEVAQAYVTFSNSLMASQ